MSSEIEIAGIKISGLDWDATPESVKAVVVALSEELEGEDVEVYRHQIVEIPRLSPYVIEHQQHQLECACCGQKTRGKLPCEVPSTGYGDRLAAVVGWLSGEHRQSHRMVKSLMATLFNVELSRGSINRLRRQVIESWI